MPLLIVDDDGVRLILVVNPLHNPVGLFCHAFVQVLALLVEVVDELRLSMSGDRVFLYEQ